mgnify:CR=1 FL=1
MTPHSPSNISTLTGTSSKAPDPDVPIEWGCPGVHTWHRLHATGTPWTSPPMPLRTTWRSESGSDHHSVLWPLKTATCSTVSTHVQDRGPISSLR